MATQTLIIGLGQFGMATALALARHGGEVIAVDRRESRVSAVADHVADAVALDAMDEQALASLSPAQRNLCICAIGDENREGSIIVTALLRQLGAQRIIARAIDPLHARILALVGANEVVQPEQAFGERLAMRVAWRNVRSALPLGDGLVLAEIELPQQLVGRSLADLDLPGRFGVTVCGVRRGAHASVPDPRSAFLAGDIVFLVGAPDALQTMTEALA